MIYFGFINQCIKKGHSSVPIIVLNYRFIRIKMKKRILSQWTREVGERLDDLQI